MSDVDLQPDEDRPARVAVILPSDGYRTTAFLDAASSIGLDVVVATDQAPPMATEMEDRLVVVDLNEPDASAARIAAMADRLRIDAVVGVDDQGVLIAATADELLGLPGNPPDAVAATRDKAEMRSIFESWSIPQPTFRVVPHGADVAGAATAIGFPCIVKPVSLSASTGVIRADSTDEAVEAAARIRAILDAHDRPPDEPLLVERFIAGDEFAIEGLMVEGRLDVLAIFDKPDAPDGPYFEETIYVTPSRLSPTDTDAITSAIADGCRALGLDHGPVHAEVRLGRPVTPPADDTGEDPIRKSASVYVLEIAARSIGGMCSRVLQFGSGITLEEVILRNALGLGTRGLERSEGASGVMMIPIPRSGLLTSVDGTREALEVDGVLGVEITASLGRHIDALPDGGRYLGFIFARGSTSAGVEASLRDAHSRLRIEIRDETIGAAIDGRTIDGGTTGRTADPDRYHRSASSSSVTIAAHTNTSRTGDCP